jgi:hypothetical protein
MSAVTAETPIAAGPGEPYRGIEEFRFVDAPIFFGRQNEVSALLRLVTIYRGVLLFGDSGAGKSSLINAGLMPIAVEDGFAPERIRVQPKAGEEFVIERIAPADDSQYIPSIFSDNDDARRIGISAAEFRKRIDERCGRRAGGVRPILVFDQFEELVTLTEQRRSTAESSQVYETIADTLLDLLRDETLPVKLLFVFRDDHYAKLSKFFACYPNLSDHSLRLEPLHVRELRTVIEGPFQSGAVSFDHALPEPVIDSLVAELTERCESDLLNLSEVQIASLRLWRDADPEKTLKTLGVRGILEAYFENAIDVVPAHLRHAAIALLTRMVTSSNTRNVVSAEELIAELGEEEKISSAVAQEALDALEKMARVVHRARRNEVVIYEIVSEFLIPWIVRQKWLAKTRRETAEREKRLTRAFWGVVIALGIALLAFGVIVYRTSNKVLAQDLKATKATLESAVEQHEAYAKASESREKELGEALVTARNEHRAALVDGQALAQARVDVANALKERNLALDEARNAKEAAHNTADAFEDLNIKLGNANQIADQADAKLADVMAKLKAMTVERDKLLNERDSLKQPPTAPVQQPEADRTMAFYGVTVRAQTDLERAIDNASGAVPYRNVGVVVTKIDPGSPANKSKLKAGDLIRAIDGQEVRTLDEFNAAMKRVKPNSTVTFHITRATGGSTWRFLKTPKG